MRSEEEIRNEVHEEMANAYDELIKYKDEAEINVLSNLFVRIREIIDTMVIVK